MKAYSDLHITLNFLAIGQQDFRFIIYAKPFEASKEMTNAKDDDVRIYRLPSNCIEPSSDNYSEFAVRLLPHLHYIQKPVAAFTNHYLTQYILFKYLCMKCDSVLKINTYLIDKGFRNRVSFVIAESNVGYETIWLEPYFLHSSQEFGFLVGYHFALKPGQPFNKDVLQKSLSITPDGRENTNFYADNYRKLEEFWKLIYAKIFPLEINDAKVELVWPPKELPAHCLDTKAYIFAKGKRDTSQFQGVKKFGPLQPIQDNSLICFIYRPKDKPLSYDLFHALKGDKYATFPGMEKMFSFSLGKEHVTGVPLENYDDFSINAVTNHISSFASSRPVLPLVLFPWMRLDHNPEGIDAYYKIKYQFLAKKMPTQFVSLQRICGRDGLKWSISNIALAVFSKLGGKPWKLSTNQEKCLIIGIGQAHRRDGENISRYFAYSVLSDSSGLYDSIKILSESENEKEYLHGLTKTIKAVIEDLSGQYEKFVIHTPFKIKLNEMQAIQKALEETDINLSKKTFVVLKFNDNSKYFGFALNNNSKVPYESSHLDLGKRQHLIWFEGLQYHNPTIRRRISRPMHIEFVYSNKDLSCDDEKGYLQDALNLSGANWRGFNAKTLPVSVYYAKLIAEYIREFDRLGLPEINIENLPPWFL